MRRDAEKKHSAASEPEVKAVVDIHCHILPAVDDGPGTLEQAISMVRMACASGTTDIVATPHANPRYTFDPKQIKLKISELELATDHTVRIHAGCDFHLSATNIQDALAHPTKYAINHRSYLLVEFADFLIPPTTAEVFDRMRAVGIVPIITHPERNHLLQQRPDEIRTWVENGCLVQVTAQSFLGRFGKSAKALADSFMRSGLIHFVASDGHDPEDRPPVLAEAYRYVTSTYGESQAHRLFLTNPQATLMGVPLEPLEWEPQKKRKWYQLR